MAKRSSFPQKTHHTEETGRRDVFARFRHATRRLFDDEAHHQRQQDAGHTDHYERRAPVKVLN